MKQFFYFFLILPFLVYSQDFSKEDYVYLKRDAHISIDFEKGNFNIVKNISEQAKFQTGNKLYFANESIGYNGFMEVGDIKAYTLLPETNRKIEVDHIETKQQFDNMVFYSDDAFKSFTFPAVSKGAITHLNYDLRIKEPRFLGGYFNFATYVPTQEANFSVEFPKNVEIGFIHFNTENIQIDFKKEEKKKKNIYTWTVSNIDSFELEDDSEAVSYYLPHIIVYIKNYKYKGKTHTLLSDVNDLYKWYSSLLDKIDPADLDEVHTLAEDITKAALSKKEKAEVIFNWVQDNINYIAFGDGLGGFVPRDAANVYKSRYGDCKAMSNLMFEMLNHVGVKAHHTWIGSRNKPYSYYEVPTPIVDDHMITAAIIENDTIFLDGTDSFVPFGMPSAFTQNKESLISIDDNNYVITKVPIPAPDMSVSKITSEISLEEGVVKASEKRIMSGYEKVNFIDKYRASKDDLSEEEFLNTTYELGNNKTSYTDIKIDQFNNKRIPLELSYNLSIENYAKEVAGKIYLNLNIDRTLNKSKVNIEGRKFSKKIDYTFKKEYETSFHIPKGYSVSFLPKPLEFDHPKYGYRISYTQKDNKIIQSKTIYINTLTVDNDEFESWNNFIKSLIKAYKKSITLEKTS